MNTSPLPAQIAAQVCFGLALMPLLMGTAAAATAAAPAPAAAQTGAPKTHVLFMGADITLEKDKEVYRVEDVTAGALVIRPGGKPVNVPLDQPTNLQINEALKIASASVGLDGLKAERAYTAGADPFLKMARSATLAAGESAVSDLAQGQVMMADQNAVMATGQLANALTPEDRALAQANVAQAQGAQASAQSSLVQSFGGSSSGISDPTTHSVESGIEASREMFDSIRLSFAVTSDRDLAQPYYAFIARIRERDSKPGQLRKWAYVKSLGPLSAGVPKNVNVYRSGLPPGYILENYEVHLYNQGEELATNLSRKRVPLTDEEALDFRIIEYVGANKGRTLPAVAVTTTLPGDLRAALTTEQLGATCHVRVAKDGRVAAAFRDAAGRQPLRDPSLESALKRIRFKPALEAGKPVEAITALSLAQLASP